METSDLKPQPDRRNELQDWLHLDLDARLGDEERSLLRAALRDDAALAQEQRELSRLDAMLTASRLPVGAELTQQVMTALPAAGWEARHPRRWGFAAGLLLVLGSISAGLVGMGSARLQDGGSFLAALAAVGDMFQSTALAGAGLLGASWKGLGLALGDLLAGSLISLLALGVLVLCLNFLFFTLWKGTVGLLATAESRGAPPVRRR